MSPLVYWGIATLLYLGFRAWYDNWRGALRPEEIRDYLGRLEGSKSMSTTDLGEFRRFLEDDDGREFVMINLVRLHPGQVPHPETGVATKPRELLRGYLAGFMPTLLRHGGVPMLQYRKVGPYVDSWGIEPDPGWTIVGAMRYRSRRDMVSLACDPRFMNAHGFKFAAIAQTFSFPTQPGPGALIGPRVWVALVLALMAALLQIATG